ncbi:MAG: DNA-binding CsgD family transcriptional regulator [Gammaproteobacteria bacterium]|jgi:DNA-binding CsgD family transcriptional regulator
MLVDLESLLMQVPVLYGYPRNEMHELYEGSGAAQRDIRVQYIDNLIPGQVFREFEYVTDRYAYDSNEWLRHDLEKRGLYWNMTARISTDGLWNDFIAINRLKTKGPYADDEKAALQTILPHLARAAELHRTVSRLEDIYGAVLSVLDKLLVGLVILDTRGRVVLTNAAASRAADDSGALSLTSDARIHATDTATDSELQKLIAATAQTVEAAGVSDGGRLLFPARALGKDLLIELMPIRDDGLPDGDNIRGVAVFIIDPSRAHILNTDGLAKIFSLTPSESVIAKALVNGAKARDIAEERRTSYGTVRGQIKSIFGKTGAGSQGDLVRLAAKADPPIERE